MSNKTNAGVVGSQCAPAQAASVRPLLLATDEGVTNPKRECVSRSEHKAGNNCSPGGTTPAFLAEHFRSLCEKHGVSTYEHPECRPYAYPSIRLVHIHPVVDEKSYVTAMHELGHVVLCHEPSQPRAWKELLAWRWAEANAAVWSEALEDYKAWCLATWDLDGSDNPLLHLI